MPNAMELTVTQGIPIAIAAGEIAVEGVRRRFMRNGGNFSIEEEIAKYTDLLEGDM